MYFLKLIIHQDNYDRDVVRTSDLNQFKSFTLLFLRFLLGLASIEKIYQTLKRAFDHISKRFEARQKNSTTRLIFNSLLGV